MVMIVHLSTMLNILTMFLISFSIRWDRRAKYVLPAEQEKWNDITPGMMSDEERDVFIILNECSLQFIAV